MGETKSNLKIVLITQGLNEIAKFLLKNYNVICVVESAPRIEPDKIKKWMIRLYQILKKKNLEYYCKKLKIPYLYLSKFNNHDITEEIKKLNPDLIIVYSMSQLLKKDIIEIPKYGCINLHPSYLPKYRGPNPILWQLFFDEEHFGVTLHFIDEGEDTGDIIYQEEFKIEIGSKLEQITKKYMDIGKEMLSNAIKNIDNLPRTKQPQKSPTIRAKNINPYEYRKLIEKKLDDVEKLFRFLCGTENYFNDSINDSKFYNFYIESFNKTSHNFNPGNITKIQSEYYFIAKDGLIKLKKQFSLKRFLKRIFK